MSSWLPVGDLEEKSGNLHLFEEVHGVVARGTVGSQTDFNAMGEQAAHRCDTSLDLCVAGWAMRYFRPRFCQHGYLGLGEIQTVSSNHIRPEEAQSMQVLNRTLKPAPSHLIQLVLGLSDMDEDSCAEFIRSRANIAKEL
jgi:hypothetical protein